MNDPFYMVVFSIIGFLIGLAIFYNIVKAAVRNGIREARADSVLRRVTTPNQVPWLDSAVGEE